MILCLPYLYPYVVYFGIRLIQPKKKPTKNIKERQTNKTEQTKQKPTKQTKKWPQFKKKRI